MVSNIFLTWWSFIAIVLSQLEIALTNIFRGAHRKTACCHKVPGTLWLSQSNNPPTLIDQEGDHPCQDQGIANAEPGPFPRIGLAPNHRHCSQTRNVDEYESHEGVCPQRSHA